MHINKGKVRILPYVFPLLLIFITIILIFNWDSWIGVFSNKDEFLTWIDSFGLWTPVVFAVLQFLQVVIFVIPGEIPQIAGGYLFGVFFGVLLSFIGISLGSVLNFYVGRIFGKPFVEKIVGRERMDKYSKYSENPKAEGVFFLLFLIPGLPKDALCYFAGMSKMSLGFFMLFSFLGRFPGILASAFIGSSVFQGSWGPVIILLSLSVIIFLFTVFKKEAIHRYLDNYHNRKGSKDEK